MLNPLFRRLMLLVLLGTFPSGTYAQSEKKPAGEESASFVESALKRRLIDPELPLKEVQEFTEERVLPVPEFKSIEQWELFVKKTRQRLLEEVVLRGAAAEWAAKPTLHEKLDIIEKDGYRIHKLRFEAVPGLWIPALLYEPEKLEGRVPVVLNVNGHDGNGKAADYKQTRCINQAKKGMLALNLEWVGMGQLRNADFVHYKMNQLDLCGTSGLAVHYLSQKRGLDILLNHPHADPSRVAVAGLSGGGWQTIFISGLDPRITLSNPVAGYSSFKTRARFTSDLGDSEQTPSDLATVADYSLLTAMLAPHPTLLTNNVNDACCFKAEHAQPPLVHAAAPLFDMYDRRAWLRTHVNHDPGSHNFEKDNREQLYKMIGDHFFGGLQPVIGTINQPALKEHSLSEAQLVRLIGSQTYRYLEKPHGLFAEVQALMKSQTPELKQPELVILVSRHFDGETPETLGSRKIPTADGAVPLSELVNLTPLHRPHFDPEFSGEEIECSKEILSAEELNVPLPEENPGFHSLAVEQVENLESIPLPPEEAPRSWLIQHRQGLRELVSFHEYDLQPLLENEEVVDGTTIRYWWLRLGGVWTVPATEFIPADGSTSCRLLISDAGRASLTANVEAALAAGERVLTFDPFYMGESKISQRDFLYGLLVATIGERNLGLQASQIAAIAQWAAGTQPTGTLTLSAAGPRSSLMALTASVCEPATCDVLDLHDTFASLREVIEQDLAVNQMPELFCFGLLNEYDIPLQIALSGAQTLKTTGNAERVQSEWSVFLEGQTQAGPKVILEE